ncbi:hypothetical protein [Erythrobacter sp. EC-HK427]|uniref:hypothetical protein n=1 Tax=Erythrobacter sp. EC-HK427 TaxID=2038396 RepID=UPI00125712D3|nr:hypothetical protein [Erythrobacter sp. EC-HK427]VVT06607.1 conserved exported hypothetical protein [Erythrobacter sp. EC-HK427]
MMRLILLFALALLAIPAAALAQEAEGNQEGTWALRINDATIWVFTMDRQEDGSWEGNWLRPARFEGNGVVFVAFSGEELVTAADGSEREGVVQLRFPPTQRGGTGDVLHFAMTGDYTMSMEYLGTELEPYPLVRVVRGTGLGPFADGMIYDRDNAQTVADYDPADEPDEAELATPETAVAAEEMADPVQPSDDAADEPADSALPVAEEDAGEPEAEAPRPSRMTDDFLAGLDAADGDAAEVGSVPTPDPIASADENTRTCSDLDRRNLPDPAGLDALWGADYEQLGDGLDIREYVMGDGQIARVTVLDDRIYLNRCGPA